MKKIVLPCGESLRSHRRLIQDSAPVRSILKIWSILHYVCMKIHMIQKHTPQISNCVAFSSALWTFGRCSTRSGSACTLSCFRWFSVLQSEKGLTRKNGRILGSALGPRSMWNLAGSRAVLLRFARGSHAARRTFVCCVRCTYLLKGSAHSAMGSPSFFAGVRGPRLLWRSRRCAQQGHCWRRGRCPKEEVVVPASVGERSSGIWCNEPERKARPSGTCSRPYADPNTLTAFSAYLSQVSGSCFKLMIRGRVPSFDLLCLLR